MLFFFDTDDGERRMRDEFGLDLADEGEAVEQAVALLRDLSHVEVVTDRPCSFSVTMRGASGAAVYTASLDLKVVRMG